MADEPETIAPTEQESPAIETVQSTAPDEPQTIPDPGEDTEPEPVEGEAGELADPAPEYVTLERNGRQYQVPKELEGEFLMQSDYTKKTQTVAQQVKELADREQRITEQSKASEDELRSRASLIDLDEKLQAYADVDWLAFVQQDPAAAQQHKTYFDQLSQQKAAASSRLTELQTKRTQEAQQSYAKRVEETRTFAQTKIPGWSPEIDAQIQQFAAKEGVPEDFIRSNLSPVLYKVLHRAWIGEQALSKQATAARPIPTLKPLSTVKGGSGPASSRALSDLAKSDDATAYIEARKAGRVR